MIQPQKVMATSLFLLLCSLSSASAYWRMSCFGITGIAPLDPLVSPGEISSHVHTIKGAGAFSNTVTIDELLNSSCTSCDIKQDKSAYWTPTLYFMGTDGTTTIVPEVAGHLTYYKYVPAFVKGIHTYPITTPNGLKMISGNPYRRNFTLPVPDPPLPWSGIDATQESLAQKAIGFNCLGGPVVEGSLYRHFMPPKSWLEANCPSGLRLELLFPICWNGKDLDTPDHKSHMRYSDAGLNGGNCPDGFDTVINQIFFETIFDTNAFKGQDGIFALSNADPTGYGYHGDVIVAWDEGVLEEANTKCGPDGLSNEGQDQLCSVFEIQSRDEQESCKIEMPSVLKGKNVQTELRALPGNNALQYGPSQATPGGGAVPSPSTALSTAVVPTLSVIAGSTGVMGNIFNQLGSSTTSSIASSSTPVVALPIPLPATPNILPAPLPSVPAVAAAPPVVTAPAPSQAPVLDYPLGPGLSILSTTTYTKDRQLIELVVVEEVVTVTYSPSNASPSIAPVKRNAHHHEALRHKHHRRSAHEHAA